MTVKQLIKKLQKQDQDRIVVLSSDQEGNSYSTLLYMETCAYQSYDRSVGLEKLTKKLKDLGYTDEDVCKGEPAIVLYP